MSSSASSPRAPSDGTSSRVVAVRLDTMGELAQKLGPVGVIALVLLGTGLIGLFHQVIWKQVGFPFRGLRAGFSWEAPSDWGHAYIVPLIAGAYVWTRREALARVPVRVFWPALSVIMLGLVCYVYFLMGFSNHMFQGAAAILVVGGAVMLVLGPAMLRALSFPLAYLGLALTISEMVMEGITFQLKLFASLGSHVVLSTIGIENDLEGNVLKIINGSEVIPLNVAQACSGMRMVVAFIALSVAVAFFSCRQWWQRILIVLLSIPVAVLTNVVRVTVLAALTLVNPNFSVGQAHTFIGTLLLVPAFLLFMGCVWVVKRITPEDEAAMVAQEVSAA